MAVARPTEEERLRKAVEGVEARLREDLAAHRRVRVQVQVPVGGIAHIMTVMEVEGYDLEVPPFYSVDSRDPFLIFRRHNGEAKKPAKKAAKKTAKKPAKKR